MKLVAAYKVLKFYKGVLTLRGLIFGVFGGFVIGMFLSYYHKSYLGELPRRLIKRGATTPDGALSLKDVGLRSSYLLTRDLKEGATLRRFVEVANPDECLTPLEAKRRPKIIRYLFPEKKKYAYDFEKMKLFVPEEKKIGAEIKYEQKKKTSPVWLLIFTLLLAALAVGVSIAIPDLVQFLDNFLSMNFN